MNIFEYSERYNISLAKARRQMKDGVLRIDETTSEGIIAIRHHLSRGHPLTAAQLVELVDNAGAVMDLGRYASLAEKQVAALGNVRSEAAPKLVAAYVTDAAKGDKEAVAALIAWLKDVIPAKPVEHNYLAVRLLLGLAPNIRRYDIPRVPRALHECRKSEDFAGWWQTVPKRSRNVTIYQRPKKLVAGFDL